MTAHSPNPNLNPHPHPNPHPDLNPQPPLTRARYDGSAHQNAHCGAWETFEMTRDGTQIARDGVALRTAHASFVSALSDRRQLGHALGLG